MKRHDRIPGIRKTKEENRMLEEETRKMEQRLQMLKSMLQKDMPKELRNNNTALWEASSQSAPTEHLNRVGGKLDMTKIKLRTLKRDTPASVEKPVDNSYTELLKKVMTDRLPVPEVDTNSSAPQCGQCENKSAVVSCQECNEDYCAKCFAQFHMKGALRRHHSLPISSNRNALRKTPKLVNQDNQEPMRSPEIVQMQSQGCQSGEQFTQRNSLTVQTRNGAMGDGILTSSVPHRESRGTSVERPRVAAIQPRIEFTSSLSYAERLLVHRNRRDPIPQTVINSEAKLNHDASTPSGSVEESDDYWTQLNTNRPTFEQLHRLATQCLTTSDLYDMCQVEDIEESSGVASLDCSAQIVAAEGIQAVGDREDANSNLHSSIEEKKRTGIDALSDVPRSPSKPSSVHEMAENNIVDSSQKPSLNSVSWRPDATYSANTAHTTELNTIELIKAHLNRMTLDHQ